MSPNACVSTQSNPACSPFGLVAAFEGTTFADKVTVYSNSTSFLDILAPSNCAFTSAAGGGTTDCFGGTSAATPFASGTAALVLQAAGGWNSLNRAQMTAALAANGDPVTDGRMGRTTPRVNAWATITAVGGTVEICDDGTDNDGDGDVDCADSDCTGDPECAPVGSCLFAAGFDGGSDGFTFVDDPQDPAYVSGAATGGNLTVTLGGIDNADISNMVGAWERSCDLGSATDVDITVVANLTQSAPYESNEFSEVRPSVNGSNSVLATVTGNGEGGSPISTGVQTYTISTTLPAGTNTVGLECFNNLKTFNNESTVCAFDSIEIAESGGPPPPPPPGCAVDDDFESGAAGWTTGGTCTTGTFVVGTPTQVVNGGVTTQVGGANSGSNALFTATNSSAGVNDVDGGNCTVTSPIFSVSSASPLSIAYFHGQRDTGDDPSGDFFTLEVSTNGGSSFTSIASNGDTQQNAAWSAAGTSIPAGANVVVRVQCSDGAGPGDLVECGIDDLSICPN